MKYAFKKSNYTYKSKRRPQKTFHHYGLDFMMEIKKPARKKSTLNRHLCHFYLRGERFQKYCARENLKQDTFPLFGLITIKFNENKKLGNNRSWDRNYLSKKYRTLLSFKVIKRNSGLWIIKP